MILIIHEKRDQAEKVGAAMGWTKDVKNRCYNGFLNGQPCVSVWSKGHILGIKDPKESMPNMSWDDPRSLLPIQRDSTLVISKDAKDTKPGFLCSDYLKTIEKYIINADLVIGGTDPDREGEAIFWNFIKYFKYTGPVKRLWLAAGLDTVSIKEAMNNLREPDISIGMAFAADSRRESDWCYMLLVVAYTYYGRYSVFGKNLEGVISLGRVQTPTLSLVVKRDYEVENFIPKDHFKISSSFNVGGAVLNGARYSPTITREMTLEPSNHIVWEQSRKVVAEGQEAPIDTPLYINKANVDDFKKRLLANANMAKISSYKESLKKEQPKKPFTSNTAIAAIVNKCKISTAAAQEVIEDLYAQGWTAYPRTSKSDLPYNLYLPAERNSLISSVLSIPELSAQAKEAMDIHNGDHSIFKPFVPTCFSKAEMEHYGIIPTHQVMTVAKLNSLPVSNTTPVNI